MNKEISNVLYDFIQKTLFFFNTSNNMSYLLFFNYIYDILVILLLIYILFWFWKKVFSPIITTWSILYKNIKNWSNKEIDIENRIAILLLSTLIFIWALYFIKDIFYIYSNKEEISIIWIIIDMISIWLFFYVSHIFSLKLDHYTNMFIKNKEWFWLIWLYSFSYILLIGFFYPYIIFLEKTFRDIINYIINVF